MSTSKILKEGEAKKRARTQIVESYLKRLTPKKFEKLVFG